MQRNSYSGRGDGRIRATPSGIAASLAEGIIQGTNVLRERLKEQQFPSHDPKRFESEECIVECVLFEWFLRDLYGVKVVASDAFTRGLVDRGIISLGFG